MRLMELKRLGFRERCPASGDDASDQGSSQALCALARRKTGVRVNFATECRPRVCHLVGEPFFSRTPALGEILPDCRPHQKQAGAPCGIRAEFLRRKLAWLFGENNKGPGNAPGRKPRQ